MRLRKANNFRDICLVEKRIGTNSTKSYFVLSSENCYRRCQISTHLTRRVQSVLPAVEFALGRQVGIIILVVVLIVLALLILVLLICDRHCTLERGRRRFPLLPLPLLLRAPRLLLRVALSAFGGSDEEKCPNRGQRCRRKK